MTSPTAFLFAILILLLAPGPTNTLLGTSGALLGIKRSLSLLLGTLTGYLGAVALILTLFEPILQQNPQARQLLALVVGLYILYLAVRIWMRSGDATASADIVSLRKVFTVTLLNPKAFVFALTVLPAGHPQLHWYFVVLGVCIPLSGLCWIALGHLIASTAGRDNLTLFNRCSSVILTGFAGYIITSAL